MAVPRKPISGVFTAYREMKYTGPIHLSSYYKDLHEWILENEYAASRGDIDFPEYFYYDSRTAPGGAEIWIWWRASYVPEGNPFYRRVIRIDVQVLNMRDVEIMVNNKKIKAQWGEHKTMVNAILETDYKGEWRKHSLLKYLYPTFWKRLMWRDLEKHKHELLDQTNNLTEYIKNAYGMRHFAHRQKSFRPMRGFGEPKPYGVVEQ